MNLIHVFLLLSQIWSTKLFQKRFIMRSAGSALFGDVDDSFFNLLSFKITKIRILLILYFNW